MPRGATPFRPVALAAIGWAVVARAGLPPQQKTLRETQGRSASLTLSGTGTISDSLRQDNGGASGDTYWTEASRSVLDSPAHSLSAPLSPLQHPETLWNSL